eukprot:TRINITY_DN11602_c0_g1_i1.p1 TRINITY_DN11602_c0_g1~~TRINITY_DN11602_c0_g1_i1.p1  ORF type:complete len:200 (+),score=18.64 TRINITY_DN11602_c0_g1_i1:181-780(+)
MASNKFSLFHSSGQQPPLPLNRRIAALQGISSNQLPSFINCCNFNNVMPSLGEDTSPLLIRIKLRSHDSIDPAKVDDIRQISQRKLAARKCSLHKALLIHKALPHLEREADSGEYDVVADVLTPDAELDTAFDDHAEAQQCTPPRRLCTKRSHDAATEDSPVDDEVEGDFSHCQARRRMSDGSSLDIRRRTIGQGLCMD